MNGSDDVTLWRRCQTNDDAEAFAELFDRYHEIVYRYCFRRVADWSLAEDLAATVFLEAWRKRGRATLQHGLLKPWLLGVATNVVRNQRRSTRRYRNVIRRMPPLRPESDFSDDLSERLDAARAMRRLLAELSPLPRRDHEVLALCWEGLTPPEIAAALNMTQAAVRGRIFRLRRRVRAAGLDPFDPVPSCEGARS